MSAAHNKAIVRRIFEVLLPSATLPDEIDQVVSETFVDHNPAVPERARGLDSIRATHEFLHRTFGRVHFTIEDIVGEADQVVVRWTAGPVRAIAWFRSVSYTHLTLPTILRV